MLGLWLAVWLAFELSIVCMATALLSGVGRSWSRQTAGVVHGSFMALLALVWLLA